MATSSILGGTPVAAPVTGKDTDALGPSDNSDSGSDAQGAYGDGEMHSDSDSVGTGERATAGDGLEEVDADILPDHIEKNGEEMLDEDANDMNDMDSRKVVEAADVDELAGDEGVDDGEEDPD